MLLPLEPISQPGPQISQLHNAIGLWAAFSEDHPWCGDRGPSCLHPGSLAWLPGPLRNPAACHTLTIGLWLLRRNPGLKCVNATLRGQFWPKKAVHPSGRPVSCCCSRGMALSPCLLGEHPENPQQLPSLTELFILHLSLLQLHPLAAQSTPKKPGSN